MHNCLTSCCAPIRGSIPPGLEGGEVFCYADTIDGNCRAAKNLKMWPPACQSLFSPPVAASPEESYSGPEPVDLEWSGCFDRDEMRGQHNF